ncbi:family 78 glycoside hydrolase catalytic domain [Dysgonomonas sp. Marseille-P4677]|uniref:family 78 glycoside hydrolase catalytic domain n=1 Tax=Dysgonomonas sp. Marseille-P4677 TaxID=2364790 RepID=UPI00191242F1|nr:family 78 glycoside hydrolase catalytic domain [Dysgonomonas sp. Marseille-P4677]MBK5720023.1 family 78 glycoside hydrolase catalytic domain [Dysgonomonas sp. Marseille-P4677]
MQKRTYLIFTIVSLILIATNCNIRASVIVYDLKCENLINPNAIDNTSPHFSWKIDYTEGTMQQKYYEIQVASDSVSLLKNKGDLWSSGKQKGTSSIMIPYNGKELVSRSLCYWRVRIWNQKKEVSEWSEIARFGVGIIDQTELQGSYIGLSSVAGNIQSPLLRKSFDIKNKNTSFLHINALGYYEVYINGKKVSDDVLSPAVSQLNKRSLIVTYDVTPYLKEGRNDLVLWLAKGWYRKNTFNAAYDGPLVRAQLDIKENNQWHTLISTNDSWAGRHGGYIETGTWQALQFAGEKLDGRVIPKDLNPTTLDQMVWYPAVEVQVPEHQVTPEMTEPNKIQETVIPRSIKQLRDSVWLIDMGKALNGWFEIRLPKLKEGKEVLIEYTDFLDKEGQFLDQGQSDIYVGVGNGTDIFCNKFHNHAFQYIRISNLATKPKLEDIKAYLIHTNYRSTSAFECSDPELNAIHNMIQYTMKCLAYSGYMVDCPHLERAGYGGDGNSSTESLQTMYDVAPLFTNWMQAWDDSMREGGSLPHVAPNPGAGGGGPYWCGFIIMAPWQTYLNYNDSRLIKKHYPAMKKWLTYVEKYTVDGLLKRWPDTPYRDWFLGDWLAPMGVDSGNELSINLVNNCFVSDCFSKMGKMAKLLGKEDDAKEFAIRKENLNQLLHKTYYNDNQKTYSTGSQLDMSYPMLVGVTPPSIYAKVKEQLFALTTKNHNNHIAVGLVGVPILTKWAIENKAVDFMYTMLKKHDYPGFLHMIDNGASTTWEYWSGERSRIHNCYNGIGSWFYQAIGGIRTDENKPGYQHVIIDPQIPQGVSWAKTTKESPYGTISVDWNLKADRLTINVVLPVGSTGTVILPQNMIEYKLNKKNINNKNKNIVIGNGSYTIDILLEK